MLLICNINKNDFIPQFRDANNTTLLDTDITFDLCLKRSDFYILHIEQTINYDITLEYSLQIFRNNSDYRN